MTETVQLFSRASTLQERLDWVRQLPELLRHGEVNEELISLLSKLLLDFLQNANESNGAEQNSENRNALHDLLNLIRESEEAANRWIASASAELEEFARRQQMIKAYSGHRDLG